MIIEVVLHALLSINPVHPAVLLLVHLLSLGVSIYVGWVCWKELRSIKAAIAQMRQELSPELEEKREDLKSAQDALIILVILGGLPLLILALISIIWD